MRLSKKLKEKAKNLSVLYVEDDKEIQKEIFNFLIQFFDEINTADNGEEGLNKFKKKSYDIVVTDIKMPYLDGLAMAKEIKKLNKRTKIIVTSAFDDKKLLLEAIENDIDHYIIKPIDFSSFLIILYNTAALIHLEKRELNEIYLQAIFDTESNMTITTLDKKTDRANKALLEFFGSKDLDTFKQEHNCICNQLEDVKGYLRKTEDWESWLEYIYANPDKTHKAVIKKENKQHIFEISAKKLLLDAKDRDIVTLTDITELENSKRRFQALVEDINDWVWEVDARGRYTYASPKVKDILGYEPEEIIGKTPFDLMPLEEAQRVGELFLKIAESAAPIKNLENINIHKNKESVILETNGKPILDEAGRLIGYRGVDRDITERKKLEEELKLKDEMMITQSRQAAMGDMIAMIAHQWRQPITVIAMAANNLKLDIDLENEITTSTLNHMIDIVSDQTQHLSKTIDDFRNFFKPNKEKVETTVCEVIDNTMKIVGKSLENNNIEIRKTGSCGKKIYTFENELLQVFLNIIGNAKDAIKNINPKEAFIQISVSEEKGSIKTVICDNGGGIPENAIKKVGEPYFSTKGQSGTGLGLYMSKTIIEKHLNGTLTWENSGDGICFAITLPIEDESEL